MTHLVDGAFDVIVLRWKKPSYSGGLKTYSIDILWFRFSLRFRGIPG